MYIQKVLKTSSVFLSFNIGIEKLCGLSKVLINIDRCFVVSEPQVADLVKRGGGYFRNCPFVFQNGRLHVEVFVITMRTGTGMILDDISESWCSSFNNIHLKIKKKSFHEIF